jgi:malonyl CoA-acyl carrier protein transacylase
MNIKQGNELLQQMLETEIGGVQVYETALTCALNEELKEEWEKYLVQTKRHVETVKTLMDALDVAPQERPGRLVRHIGGTLVAAMELAKGTAPPEAAEIVPANAWCTLKPRITPTGSFSAPMGNPPRAKKRK